MPANSAARFTDLDGSQGAHVFTEMKNPFFCLKCGRRLVSSSACLIILELPASTGGTAIFSTLPPLHSETPVAGSRIEIKFFWFAVNGIETSSDTMALANLEDRVEG